MIVENIHIYHKRGTTMSWSFKRCVLSLALVSWSSYGCVERSPSFEELDPTPSSPRQSVGSPFDVDQGDEDDEQGQAQGELVPAQLVLDASLTSSATLGRVASFKPSLRHIGGAKLSIEEISLRPLDEDGLSRWSLNAKSPSTLRAGKAHTVEVTYQAMSLSSSRAELVWRVRDETGLSQELVQTLEASVELERELNYPEVMDLGRLAKDKRRRILVPIYNNTDRDERLRDVYITTSPDQFKVMVADIDAPTDEEADRVFEPNTPLPAHKITYLALWMSSPKDEPIQTALIFVASVGTRQIVLRANAGVPCLSVEGALPARSGGWDYELDFGVIEPSIERREGISLVNCSQTHPLTITRAALVDDAQGQLALDGAVLEPVSLDPGQALALPISAMTPTRQRVEGVLRIQSSDQERALVRVRLSADSSQLCPEPVHIGAAFGGLTPAPITSGLVRAKVGQQVTLAGLDLRGLSLEWSFARTPVNSTVGFWPDAFSPLVAFTPDLPGHYTIELTSVSAQGIRSCRTSTLVVEVSP